MIIALYILLGVIALLLMILITVIVIHKKLFGSRFNPDPLVKYYQPDEFTINREPIEIKDKKITLRGFIYNKDKYTKKPLIVFGHGMWSDLDAYNQDICYYAQHGYEVVAVNYQGVSSSDGKSIIGLGGSIKGLDTTLNYIEQLEEFKDRDIYLVGHSWGAYGVLSTVKFHPEVKKVVAISPFASPTRLFKGMLPKAARFAIPFFLLVEKIKLGKYSNQKVLKNIENYKGDILILHSKDDPMVNYHYSTEYLQKIRPDINYMIFENKGHNPNYSDHAVECMNKYNQTMAMLAKEQKHEYKKSVNFAEMGELDSKVMEDICSFLDK